MNNVPINIHNLLLLFFFFFLFFYASFSTPQTSKKAHTWAKRDAIGVEHHDVDDVIRPSFGGSKPRVYGGDELTKGGCFMGHSRPFWWIRVNCVNWFLLARVPNCVVARHWGSILFQNRSCRVRPYRVPRIYLARLSFITSKRGEYRHILICMLQEIHFFTSYVILEIYFRAPIQIDSWNFYCSSMEDFVFHYTNYFVDFKNIVGNMTFVS